MPAPPEPLPGPVPFSTWGPTVAARAGLRLVEAAFEHQGLALRVAHEPEDADVTDIVDACAAPEELAELAVLAAGDDIRAAVDLVAGALEVLRRRQAEEAPAAGDDA